MSKLRLVSGLGRMALGIVLLSAVGTVLCGTPAAVAGAGPEASKANASDATDQTAPNKPKRRSGPPPLVHTEFLEVCASCHKPDGRGGRSYGGYAANLRETKLDYDGIVEIILNGVDGKGMPPFEGVIGTRNIDAVTTYILENFKGKPVAEDRKAHSGR